MMTQDGIDYFARRERMERAAAKSASSIAARRAHQELAENYSRLARTPLANDDGNV
jgi:hypothetical protein